MKLLSKNCGFCSKAFTIEPYMERPVNFCSRLCANRAIAKRNIGKHLSETTKKKIGIASSRKRGGITTIERECLLCQKIFKTRQSYVKRGGGQFCSIGCRVKMSIGRKFSPEHLVNISGENASNWQGGISTENEIMRKRKEYRLWREAVFSRDNWECQECHDRSREGHPVILNADHIKPFALFPELRFAIDNGITLCESCHRKTPTFGCKIRNYNMQAV